MTEHRATDDTLRHAFQALGEASGGTCSDEDLERIWGALAGELPVAERRALVDRLATDPACAEAWRIANELWQASHHDGLPAAERHVRSWIPAWFAAAAILVLGVAIGLVSLLNRPQSDEFRDPGVAKIESLQPLDTPLSRDAFRLRWTSGPQGSRYRVRVMTEDLRVLATAEDLTTPELVVAPDRLASLAPGTRVLWQVDVDLPSGERVSSQTFVARVE